MRRSVVEAERKIKAKEKELQKFYTEVLKAAGVPGNDAEIVVASLVDADLAGTNSHGVTRMSVDLNRMEQGLISPVTKIDVVRETPSTVLLDASDGWGQVASERAVELVVQKAREVGSAWIGIGNSNHIGTAAYWTVKSPRGHGRTLLDEHLARHGRSWLSLQGLLRNVREVIAPATMSLTCVNVRR